MFLKINLPDSAAARLRKLAGGDTLPAWFIARVNEWLVAKGHEPIPEPRPRFTRINSPAGKPIKQPPGKKRGVRRTPEELKKEKAK